MFKTNYIFLFAMISLTLASVNQRKIKLPPSVTKKVFDLEHKCIEETGAPPDSFSHMITWKSVHDDASKKFIYCFGTAGGYADKDGHFVVNKMSAPFGNDPQKEEFERVLYECNQFTGKDPVDTLYQMGACLHRNTPIIYAL